MNIDDKIKTLKLLVSISFKLEDKAEAIGKFFKTDTPELFDDVLDELDEAIAAVIGGKVTQELVKECIFEASKQDIDTTTKNLLNLWKKV